MQLDERKESQEKVKNLTSRRESNGLISSNQAQRSTFSLYNFFFFLELLSLKDKDMIQYDRFSWLVPDLTLCWDTWQRLVGLTQKGS